MYLRKRKFLPLLPAFAASAVGKCRGQAPNSTRGRWTALAEVVHRPAKTEDQPGSD
jgi:hypothetical protein